MPNRQPSLHIEQGNLRQSAGTPCELARRASRPALTLSDAKLASIDAPRSGRMWISAFGNVRKEIDRRHGFFPLPTRGHNPSGKHTHSLRKGAHLSKIACLQAVDGEVQKGGEHNADDHDLTDHPHAFFLWRQAHSPGENDQSSIGARRQMRQAVSRSLCGAWTLSELPHGTESTYRPNADGIRHDDLVQFTTIHTPRLTLNFAQCDGMP